MDQVIIDGMDSIFKECFYDLTPPQGITLARTTLRTLRIDQPSRELIRRIIDGKEIEYEQHKSSLPPSPDEIAAKAKEIAEAEISTTEESVGLWSRTVNSVSGFVGTAKDTVVSAAAEGKNKVDQIGVAIKVATTAIDRAECMKREFKEIYDKNRRKYEDFVAEIRGQSNRITTAISYSRTEAWTGWALIGFSLYMLSYLRNRSKDQRIEQRLAAIEEERRERERGRGQDEQLAIGNGQLAIGNGDEGNVSGVLAIGNGDPPAPSAVVSSLSSNSNSNSVSSSTSGSNIRNQYSNSNRLSHENEDGIRTQKNINYKPPDSGVQGRGNNSSEILTEPSFPSLDYIPSSSTSNASSTSNTISTVAAAAPPRSTTPGKKRWMAQKQAEENQGNSGGRRTRRRATQTKKRRRPIRRRQTRKLRRNTKRRRM